MNVRIGQKLMSFHLVNKKTSIFAWPFAFSIVQHENFLQFDSLKWNKRKTKKSPFLVTYKMVNSHYLRHWKIKNYVFIIFGLVREYKLPAELNCLLINCEWARFNSNLFILFFALSFFFKLCFPLYFLDPEYKKSTLRCRRLYKIPFFIDFFSTVFSLQIFNFYSR